MNSIKQIWNRNFDYNSINRFAQTNIDVEDFNSQNSSNKSEAILLVNFEPLHGLATLQ